ncbi:hypothetical protein C8A00DRAFT_42081 [Chaetomidium leptoderma]|uniref:Uncharacterized protein n=1 Tax=Chaetomidium leptoderma TaxID=669021 RepID=A0AAN6VPP9_9PEZI|nr:hypothetical protein C8A00DRAFT_42081 [Chaetomidium leptoderma]
MGQWQSQEVCTTPACVHGASHVLKNLAPNWAEMDPCTDFDKMVCYGTFEHGGDNAGTVVEVRKRTKNILRQIMESPNHAKAAAVKSTLLVARSSTEEDNFEMLRASYQACIDTDATAAAGLTPLRDMIVTINKTWPVSPTDLKTKVRSADLAGLQKATLFVEQHGTTVFHGNCNPEDPITPDYLNSALNRICWTSPSLYREKNITSYLDPVAMQKYADQMGDVFDYVYPNLSNKTAAALAEAVVAFEVDLVNTTVKNVTVAELAKAAPAFGFDRLVAGLTPTGKAPPVILLETPEMWPEFSNLISNHSRAAVQGFIMWQTIRSVTRYIDSPGLWRLMRIESSVERWELHIKDHYFVSATYPDLTLQAADKMTANIRKAFQKRLGEIDWMTQESRESAIKKAENMVQNIGYPKANPDLRSADSIASYYAGLNITIDRFANILSSLQHKTAKQYEAVTRKPNRNDYGNAAIVNAFYDITANAITIPAGISQLPIFHYHLPDYALYGGLGSIIGHEITHGFDSNGRKRSPDAELEAWWDNSTIANFETRAKCFVDQYSEFEVDVPTGKANVDGANTLGENLSDAGGMRAAYEAWVEDRKAMPSSWDQKLPGLEAFKSEQLFFVYWANIWCSTKTPAEMVDMLEDQHAPSLVRIKGVLQNSKAFQEAFKCKAPKARCELF